MLRSLVKIPTLLVLLLSFFLLTGTITASANMFGAVEIDFCCDADREGQPIPGNEGECSDPGCQCPTCNFLTLEFHQLPANAAQQPPGQLWPLASNSSYDYIRPIDYPPERL